MGNFEGNLFGISGIHLSIKWQISVCQIREQRTSIACHLETKDGLETLEPSGGKTIIVAVTLNIKLITIGAQPLHREKFHVPYKINNDALKKEKNQIETATEKLMK